MADLAEKSNTRFNSKIVLTTTNLQTWPTHGIIEPEALRRRFDFDVTLDLKEEYREDLSSQPVSKARGANTWSYSMKKNGDEVSPLDRNMYLFRVAGVGVFEWDEFVELCRKRFAVKKERYCSMMSDIPDSLARGIRSRGLAEQQSGVPSDFLLDSEEDLAMREYEKLLEREGSVG